MKQILKDLYACEDAIAWVGDRTLEQAWNDCERGDWMLWFAAKVLDRKIVVRATCAVARTTLKFVEEGKLQPW